MADESSQRLYPLELVIVVALIMIIAAIAIPSLTDSKIMAKEASAVASIRHQHGRSFL